MITSLGWFSSLTDAAAARRGGRQDLPQVENGRPEAKWDSGAIHRRAEQEAAVLTRYAESLRSAAQSDVDSARRRVEEAERRAQQTEDAARQRWDALRVETEQRWNGCAPRLKHSHPPRPTQNGAPVMGYSMTVTLNLPYDHALPAVKQALQEQGFGVLTEIDARATLKEKLGADMEPHIIPGAGNPQLAHRALDLDREIGLLLPCNVVVHADGDDRTVVEALVPQVMVTVSEREDLRPIADEVGHRIRAALDALKG